MGSLLQYFLRTNTISLRGARLPGLGNLKTLQVLRFPALLNVVAYLELSGLPHVSDVAVAAVVRKCQGLESLVLR